MLKEANSIVTRIRCGWKKFTELQLLLKTTGFSLRSKGAFYQACRQSVIIQGGVTWAVREEGFLTHFELSLQDQHLEKVDWRKDSKF